MEAALVLAVPQVSGEPGDEDPDVYPGSKCIRGEIRVDVRRHGDEYAAGDPLQRSRDGALPGRMHDRPVARRGRGGRAASCIRLQEYVRVRWVGSGGEPGRESEFDDHRSGGTCAELC